MSIAEYFSLLFSIGKKNFVRSYVLDASDSETVEGLFLFMSGLVANKEEADGAFSLYRGALRTDTNLRERAYIQAYTSVETQILHALPASQTRLKSIKDLRDRVHGSIDLSKLGKHFRLIFLPPAVQAVTFFSLELDQLLESASEYIGAQRVAGILRQYTAHTELAQEGDTVGHRFVLTEAKTNSLSEYSIDAISKVFKRVYEGVFTEIRNSVGEAYAIAMFSRIYSFVKATYPYDIVGLFLDAMPTAPFESERKSMLSRRDLEAIIAGRTAQLEEVKAKLEEKVSLMENQNVTLESTKKAVLNVLDDARILEESLKQERDRAKAIIASMSEGLFVVDPSYVVTMLNPKAQAILGMSADDAAGKKLSEITTLYKNGIQLAEDERPLAKTIQSGQAIIGGIGDNYSLKSTSGVIPITFATAPMRYEERIIGALVTFHDCTAEKEAKDIIERTVVERTCELREKNEALVAAKEQVSEGWLLLQKEKARLTASIHSLTLGFILTDADENVFIINPAAEKILSVEKPITKFSELETHFGSSANLHEAHEQCRSHNVPIDLKDILLGAKYLHVFLAPITVTVDGGKYIGTVVLIEDITEAKSVERSKDEFFSIASHELRTPLTAIRGNTSMIQDYFKEALKDPQLSEMIGDIHESSVRLIDIVNDFLDVSRLEQKRFEFKKEIFDIVDIAKSVIDEFQVTGSRHKLSIELSDPPQPVIEVQADKNRTKQVLLNLVGNAIKFTKTGGITLHITFLDNVVEVSIADTGRGISKENQGFLFHKFQQAGESLITRDATRGTGLGLYISKLMVEGMGGKIYLVHTEVGKGSVFAFTLPKHQS